MSERSDPNTTSLLLRGLASISSTARVEARGTAAEHGERGMMEILAVSFGGALGSGARYLIGSWLNEGWGSVFPLGTLFVNIIGSFLLALVIGLGLGAQAFSPTVRLMLTVGVMGGFTTYSTFNIETLHLLRDGSWGLAVLNVGMTLGGCALAGLLGLALSAAMVE